MISATWMLLGTIGVLLSYIYFKILDAYRHWEKKGVANYIPKYLISEFLPVVFGEISMGEYYLEKYNLYPGESMIGTYQLLKPVLVVRNPELIGNILIEDFSHFMDHSIYLNEKRSPIDAGLFSLKGSKWKFVRQKLSPSFTSDRLKWMFHQMLSCSDQMMEDLDDTVKKGDVDIKYLMTSFAMDAVASSAFGIEVREENARRENRKFCQKFVDVPFSRQMERFCLMTWPKLAETLNCSFTPSDVAEYFTRQKRKDQSIIRQDFVQLLLELKEKGQIDSPKSNKDKDDEYLGITDEPTFDHYEITDNILVAQAYQFLQAGFDAISSTMIFCSLNLSNHPRVLKKVREEIKSSLDKHGGYTYNALKDMKFLEYCIYESLRLHPLAATINRVCTKEYTTRNGINIDKGTTLIIPILGLHHDPNLFPQPERFIPERFEGEPTWPRCSYIPFGEGPRICIGMRFSLLQMKICLSKIIENYDLQLSPNADLPPEVNRRSLISSTNPVLLRFTRL